MSLVKYIVLWFPSASTNYWLYVNLVKCIVLWFLGASTNCWLHVLGEMHCSLISRCKHWLLVVCPWWNALSFEFQVQALIAKCMSLVKHICPLSSRCKHLLINLCLCWSACHLISNYKHSMPKYCPWWNAWSFDSQKQVVIVLICKLHCPLISKTKQWLSFINCIVYWFLKTSTSRK
jgi:hypothetical protein